MESRPPIYDGRRAARPQRPVWAIIGIILAVVLAIGGLAIVGLMVVVVVGMSHYGSNK
jgi:hypothetical protein